MKRDAPKVKSLDEMKTFIRYNDFKNDEISGGNPGYAISSRLDLTEVLKLKIKQVNPRAHGSIDGKVTSLKDVPKNRAYI